MGNEKRENKKNKVVGNLCIGLGLLFFGAALLLTLFNVYEGENASRASDEIVTKLQKQIPEESKDSEKLPTTIPEREMPAIRIGEYRYIGMLEVPALELYLPIMEEWDDERLKIAPCRYAGNVYGDNMVLAGHNYNKHFRRLKNLPMGSEIIFTDTEGNIYYYEIAWQENLQPEQIEEMLYQTGDDATDWDLTLFTCTTGGASRVTIRCIRIEK